MKSKILKELYKLGYDREDLNNTDIDYSNPKMKDLSYKSINHSIAKNSLISEINFDFAAATGSLYKNCNFSNCSMFQTDFEFCHFEKCKIKSSQKIISSFNSSSFISTIFEDTDFEACTFTGALFDDCTFINVRIINSTLEGAHFNNCRFYNVDLKEINMEYISISSPKMNKVILPFSQIPFMFGCLQFIKEADESVRISSQENKTISTKHYLDVAIPKLIEYWENSRERNPEFNFPLANIYISQKNYICAAKCIYDGVYYSITEEDYRMIKFYCKLLSESDIFKPEIKEMFFGLINKIPHKEMNDAKTRSFFRNIGEIKASLFELNKETTLYVKMLTSLSFNDPNKIGEYLEKLFSISKMKYKGLPNVVTFEVSENSPFTIGISINGSEDNIISLLFTFLKICKMDLSTFCFNPNVQALMPADDILSNKSEELVSICNRDKTEITLVEYNIKNSTKCEENGICTFFYNLKMQDDSTDFIKLLR